MVRYTWKLVTYTSQEHNAYELIWLWAASCLTRTPARDECKPASRGKHQNCQPQVVGSFAACFCLFVFFPNSTNKLSMLVCRCISKFIYCCLQAVFSLLSVISCICLSFYWLVTCKKKVAVNEYLNFMKVHCIWLVIIIIYWLFCKSLLYIHNGWWCLKHRNMFRKLKSVVVFLKIMVSYKCVRLLEVDQIILTKERLLAFDQLIYVLQVLFINLSLQ